MDARAALLLVFLAGLWAVLVENLFPLAVLTVLAGLCLVLAGRRAPTLVLGALGILLLGAWGLAVMQGFFYAELPRTALFELPCAWLGLGDIPFYREGFLHGLKQALRLALVSFAGLALILAYDPSQLMLGLRGLGLPRGLAFMALIAFRFVPVLGQEVRETWRAIRLRGYSPWRSAPWTSIEVLAGLPRPVLAGCVRRSQVLAASLLSRGVDASARGNGGMEGTLEPPGSGSDARGSRLALALGWWAVLAALVLTVGLLVLKVLFALYLHDWYAHTGLRPWYAFTRHWL